MIDSDTQCPLANDAYLIKYPDVAADPKYAPNNARLHYDTYGKNEGRAWYVFRLGEFLLPC